MNEILRLSLITFNQLSNLVEPYVILLKYLISICIYGVIILFPVYFKIFKNDFRFLYEEVDKKRFFIKHTYTTLFVILSVSFGLISLFFGLHTDVIISYDKAETKDNTSNLSNWFCPGDVLYFPIQQLKISDRNLDVLSIDFSKSNVGDTLYHTLIICDFSPSTNDNEKTKQFTKQLSAEIENEIIKNECVKNIVPKDYSLRDKLPLYIYLKNNNFDKFNKGDKKSFKHYKGFSYFTGITNLQNSCLLPLFQDSQWKENLSFCDNTTTNFFDLYSKNLIELKKQFKSKPNTISDFNEVLKQLNKDLENDSDNLKNSSFTLTIISDFVNQSKNSIEKELKQLDAKNIIKRCNLIVLPCKKENSGKVEEVLTLFRSYLTVKPVYIETSIEDGKPDLSTLESTVTPSINNSKSKLTFYYPYRFFQTEKSSSSKICLYPTKRGKDTIEIMFRDKRWSGSLSPTPLFYCSESNVNPNKNYAFGLNKWHLMESTYQDTLIVDYLPEDMENPRDISLEIKSSLSNKSISYEVEILPVLPKTSSRYLLLFYTFCFTSFLCIVKLYMIELNDAQKPVKFHKVFNNIIKFIAAFSEKVFLIFLFFNFLIIRDPIILISIFLSFLISWISIWKYKLLKSIAYPIR